MGLLYIESLLPAFSLVLARVAGLVLAVPILSSAQIPRMAKAWLVISLSLVVFPIVSSELPRPETLGAAVTGMAGEFLLGELLGLGAGVAFVAAQMAGHVIGHQSAMGLGQVFNPLFDEQTTAIEQVWFFTSMLVFIALRGPAAVIHALLGSFRTVPPMRVYATDDAAALLVDLLRCMLETALRLSGPAVVALLLTSLVMGFLTKTMPQLNILSVGFGFKAAVALGVCAASVAFAESQIGDAAIDGLGLVGGWMEAVAGRMSHAI